MAPAVPPNNLDAEQAVLGAILIEGATALRHVTVDAADFLTEAHRAIFIAMRALDQRGEPIDSLTVAAELHRAGDLDRAGGRAALALLMDYGSILLNLPSYNAMVVEESRRRQFMALGERLRAGALNGATSTDLATWAENLLGDLRARAARSVADEVPSELNALLAHRWPVREEIIGRGILPRRGLLVNFGKPKLGKSLNVGQLQLERGRGRPWLGFPTDPGVSLYLNAEVGSQKLAERFTTMLRHDPEPVPDGRLFIKTRRGVMLDEPAGFALISAWIEETGADLVTIDPLARFMSGDENSNRDMGAVVRALDRLIERYGISVILVHHPSKMREHETREGGERLRGAGALFGAADTVIEMARDDDGFVLNFELRNGAAPEPMRVTRTEDLWLVPAGPDPELVSVAALTVATPLTYSVLVGAAGDDLKMSKATAKRRIASALSAKLIEKDLDGLYRPGSAYHRSRSQAHGVSENA
jgi:hypothetical protein